MRASVEEYVMVNSAQGQDRSAYQPVGPWSGCTFGLVKLTEGLTYIDPAAAQNLANLKSGGLLRGVYHFFHPDKDAEAQADFFATRFRAVGGTAEDSLWCDSELWTGAKSGDSRLRLSTHGEERSALLASSAAEGLAVPRDGTRVPLALPAGVTVNSVTRNFLDAVHERLPGNRIVGTYTFRDLALTLTSCTGYKLWIADPSMTAPESVSPWPDWDIWQWSWTAGFAGSDCDAYNGTAIQMRAWQLGTLPPVVHWRNLSRHATLNRAAAQHGMTPEQMLALAEEAPYKYGPAMRRYISAGNWNAILPFGTRLYAYAR
jgi:Glycosyl hydrolases family 25